MVSASQSVAQNYFSSHTYILRNSFEFVMYDRNISQHVKCVILQILTLRVRLAGNVVGIHLRQANVE